MSDTALRLFPPFRISLGRSLPTIGLLKFPDRIYMIETYVLTIRYLLSVKESIVRGWH